MKQMMCMIGIIVLFVFTNFTGLAKASEDVEAKTLQEWLAKGDVSGSLRTYYFVQTFDGTGKNNSQIWVNGGNLMFSTAKLYGIQLGANFQASFVGSKDDEDGKTAGSMDADGAVLSEAFLQYDWRNTRFKGGRQFYSSPFAAVSGSRVIKEAFELYYLRNTDIPDTEITAGWLRKYQTRTDKTSYGDNPFVKFDTNGSGEPGDFYDVGDDGMWLLSAKNSTVKNLKIQAYYANVIDEVQGVYADATYGFDIDFSPYLAAQFYYSDWDDPDMESNNLVGVQTGIKLWEADLFAGFTTTGGSAGEARVFRGIGQGAYYQYTSTTKTSGAAAFEADTDAYQVGVGYEYAGFSGKLRFSSFDLPIDGDDLDEWTLNLLYKFGGSLENLSVSVDFTILDYENDDNDATDLRTRLIYTF